MQSRSSSVLAELVTPPFVIAVSMLAVAILLAGPVAAWKKFKRIKLALPLKHPLSTLDIEALAPYRVVERILLDPAVVEALGTDRYLNWLMEDTSVPPTDPLRYGHLLVTYYSGGPNLVPHTPDVCFLGTGYEAAEPHENRIIEVASLSPAPTAVPVRVCTFIRTAVFQRKKHSVVYTFHCNGRFVSTRTEVRVLINDPMETYSYFSKVEVGFPRATRAQSIEGTGKLFERVLPVLLKDHWPDFEFCNEAVPGKNPTAGSGGSGGSGEA